MLNNTIDTLRILADETDGRAIVNSNDLDRGLRQIVKDSSAYYLLGYTSTLPSRTASSTRSTCASSGPACRCGRAPGIWR